MQSLTIDSVIGLAESLNLDDQQMFLELFQKRLSERRRNEIADNAASTLKSIENNEASIGSASDFLNEIDKD